MKKLKARYQFIIIATRSTIRTTKRKRNRRMEVIRKVTNKDSNRTAHLQVIPVQVIMLYRALSGK